MLAKKELSPGYEMWNRKWGAPLGRRGYSYWPLQYSRWDIVRRGPFAWQSNNSTREYEYPWAYFEVTRRGKGLSVVDVGGSLAGLQFVFAQEGYSVTNVDPGLKASGLGWEVDPALHSRLSKHLHAPVHLITETLAEAPIQPHSVDVVLAISCLEHFSDEDIASTAKAITHILKPSGVLVMTVDLFLDLMPFSAKESNKWGRNIDIKSFLDTSLLKLADGNPAELYGFPEFDSSHVMSELSSYNIGSGYPCLSQCFTAVPL